MVGTVDVRGRLPELDSEGHAQDGTRDDLIYEMGCVMLGSADATFAVNAWTCLATADIAAGMA